LRVSFQAKANLQFVKSCQSAYARVGGIGRALIKSAPIRGIAAPGVLQLVTKNLSSVVTQRCSEESELIVSKFAIEFVGGVRR
jgi:hypothetical protein